MRCTRGRGLFPFYLFAVFSLILMAQLGAGNVVLMANNTTLSFDDVEATFSECYSWHDILYSVLIS
jgi:E3 ubiquitin-protein ligase RNF13